MSSWRDAASLQAQRDLDELLNATLRSAQQQIADRGGFYPYAATIRTGGQAEMISPRSGVAERPARYQRARP